jgi:hypothetical protein
MLNNYFILKISHPYSEYFIIFLICENIAMEIELPLDCFETFRVVIWVWRKFARVPSHLNKPHSKVFSSFILNML